MPKPRPAPGRKSIWRWAAAGGSKQSCRIEGWPAAGFAKPVRCDLERSAFPSSPAITEPLWNVALDAKEESQRRFQAACALANLHRATSAGLPSTRRSQTISCHLNRPPLWIGDQRCCLLRYHLFGPLSAIFRDSNRSEASRIYATETLAEFAFDRPKQLYDLLADPSYFNFRCSSESSPPSTRKSHLASHRRARQKSIRQKRTRTKKNFWRNAKRTRRSHSCRSESRSRFGPCSRRARSNRSQLYHSLVKSTGSRPTADPPRLEIEPDVTIRSALLLRLASLRRLNCPQRNGNRSSRSYWTLRKEPDPGLHGASNGCCENGDNRERSMGPLRG